MDIQIVVCAPVREIGGHKFDPATAPYSTYTQVPCPRCLLPMWLGSRAWIEVENRRATMLCLPCAYETGVYHPGATMTKLTDRDA
jgi:hypothetical protein